MAGKSKNVLGELLQPCGMNPRTGFFRDGCCKTGEDDYGSHTVCVRVTEAFLLFSSKESEFRSFLHHAPFVKGLPNESPGRLAYFIGYKMVNSYMKNNQVDIEELLSLMDSKDFLRLSKYKPTK